MLRPLCLSVLISFNLTTAFAQIIPDLTTGDHYLPGLSEQQKLEVIIKSFKEKTDEKVPNTSEELYPNLYQYSNQDYLAPIRGTRADPAKAFTDYSKNDYMKKPAGNHAPNPSEIVPAMYNCQLSTEQRNRLQIEGDIAAYEAQKKYREQLVAEALNELGPNLVYQLGARTGKEAERYENAFAQIEKMLSGAQKIDFLRAVWLVESAADESLTWEEFNKMFQDGIQVIMALMKQDKLSPNDNLAKLMTIFKYMTDTTEVFVVAREKTVVSKPMLYDYEDYAGEKDQTKVFVSKLLRTGTGQCMSLPMLFYLYAKALGADANLAFAPEHSYITFKDKTGVRQNIELTGRMLTTIDFYWETGFIKTEQAKSGIYLAPLTEKETLSYLITTLAKTYVKRHGVDDHLLQWAQTARQYDPNSLSANMLMVGYSHELWKNVVRQYDMYNLSDAELQNDETAQLIKKNFDSEYAHIMQGLGYSKIPKWAYEQWLKGVNKAARLSQHVVRRRQLEQQLNR